MTSPITKSKPTSINSSTPSIDLSFETNFGVKFKLLIKIWPLSPFDSNAPRILSFFRARNIKNKVTANQDKTSRTIAALRQEIQNLQLELMEYRQGKRVVGSDGLETTNDMYHENTMLAKENSHLRTRIKALQETVDVLTAKNSQLLADKEIGNWIRDQGQEGANNDISAMVQKYITEVEELRAKLLESEQTCEQLRKETARIKRMSQSVGSSFGTPTKGLWASPSPMVKDEDGDSGYSVQELIAMAKKDLEKNKEAKRKISVKDKGDEDKDANSADDEDDGSEEDDDDDDVEIEIDDDSDTGIYIDRLLKNRKLGTQ